MNKILLLIATGCFWLSHSSFSVAQIGDTSDESPTAATEKFVVEDAVLKVFEQRNVPCLAPGVIQNNFVHEGSLVKVGQLMMEIDSTLSKLDLTKFEKEWNMAQLEAASTVDVDYAARTIEVAQAELGRAMRSNQRSPGAVAASEIDQLALIVEKSNAEREKIQFQTKLRGMLAQIRETEVAIGRRKQADHQIKAPIEGMVVEVLKQQGEWVQASESVARIVRLDKLKTEVRIPAAIALNGLVGQSATFIPKLLKLESKRFPAKVVFVHPEANPVNSSVRVWVEIENADLELIAGLTGRLEISSEAKSVSTPAASVSK